MADPAARSIEEDVARIALERPDQRNALSEAMTAVSSDHVAFVEALESEFEGEM